MLMKKPLKIKIYLSKNLISKIDKSPKNRFLFLYFFISLNIDIFA